MKAKQQMAELFNKDKIGYWCPKRIHAKRYAINQKRLEYLEKTIKVIGDYSKALDMLDDYEHGTKKLRFHSESELFT